MDLIPTRKELETRIERVEQDIDLLACILQRAVWHGGVTDERLETIRAALIDANEKLSLLEIELNRLENRND